MKKHIVKLNKKDKNIVGTTVSKGVQKASVIRRANILLLSNKGKKDEEIKAMNEKLKMKIDELEKLNQVMIGREERILALKEEVKKLQAHKI